MYPVLFLNSLTLLLPSIMYLFVVHYLPPRSINMYPQYLIWVHFLLLVYYFTTYLQDQLSCTWSPSYWKGMTGCRGSPLVWWWVGAGSKGMPPQAPDRWLTALSVYPPYKIHIASVDIFIHWLSTLLNFYRSLLYRLTGGFYWNLGVRLFYFNSKIHVGARYIYILQLYFLNWRPKKIFVNSDYPI